MKIFSGWRAILKNVLCLVLIAAAFGYLAARWSSLPARVPGHYNAAGEVDRWGGKNELWFLPILTLALYAGLSVLEKFPAVWNTGVPLTPENRSRVLGVLKDALDTLKLVVCADFCFIGFCSASARTLPVWFLPAFLGLMAAVLVFYGIRLSRAR